MQYLVGIDVGTTATKSVLFDSLGNAVASASCEYPIYHPQNGWAEQNPEDWWMAVVKTLKEITKNFDGEVAGVGLSGQMHGLVMLSQSGEVLRNAIIWCDGRTSKECRLIYEKVGYDRLLEITANPALEGFTASKILWVMNNEPQIYAKCRHILLPKDYIRYKLTGEFATDVSDASGMQLLDIKKREWSGEVCEKLGVDVSYLAKVYESAENTGTITAEAAKLTGLKEGVAVAAGAGDNASAAVGTGVCRDGEAFTTVGTSGVVFAHMNNLAIDKAGRVHTFCCAVPNCWHIMGVTQGAGLSLKWFKETFAKEISYKELDKMCENVSIGANRLMYLPYLMGERTPWLDADARGVFFGLCPTHKIEHLGRAVMEGVSYSLKNCLDVFEEMGVKTEKMAICGGGGKSRFWRQMIADVYNMELTVKASSEGAAQGAAILGGCAGGVYESVYDGCKKAVLDKETVKANGGDHEEYMKFYKLYNSLYPNLKTAFSAAAQL